MLRRSKNCSISTSHIGALDFFVVAPREEECPSVPCPLLPRMGESIRKEGIIYLFRIDRAMLEVLEENMEEGFDMDNIDEEALEED